MIFWKQVDALLLRTAASRADLIRSAIKASVDPEQIIRAWRETHPAGGSTTPKEARAWLRIHATTKTDALNNALAQIYATGYALGDDVAKASIGRAYFKKADDPNNLIDYVNTDWSSWQPGNHPAALLVKPPNGLIKLLGKRRDVYADLTDTTLNRIGTQLADALIAGQTDTWLADKIDALLNDPIRSLTIACTEMNSAMSEATLDNYQQYGVEQKEWLSLDPCDICDANTEQGPIPVDEAFESDDDAPPAHANCRCSLIPVIDDGSGDAIEMDNSESIEMMVKGVLDAGDVERALNRLEILPNPADPRIENIEKYVMSPWEIVPVPTIDPNVWDRAEIALVQLDDLSGTDPFLRRKNVAKHILTLGQAQSKNRSYAMVIESDGKSIIVDGHHRLMALWLLGIDQAPVWLVKE